MHGALGCLSLDVSDDTVEATHTLTQHALELLMEIAEYNLKVCLLVWMRVAIILTPFVCYSTAAMTRICLLTITT